MPVTKQNVSEVFTYQPPDDRQKEAFAEIRMRALRLPEVILHFTPACADQQAALRQLRECVMTANAAVALKGKV